MNDEQISEEQLNAFVDGELDTEERSKMLNQTEHSATLDKRLCQQRKLKELVKIAYETVPEPNRLNMKINSRWSLVRKSLVAGVLITFGMVAGMFTQHQIDQQGAVELAVNQSENYILHVISNKPEKMRAALVKARQLLDQNQTSTQYANRRIEIVANGHGLDLLRSDTSPFAEEIKALADSDIAFYACSKAIERMEERGVHVLLVPEADPRYTALDRVVIRMQDGWNYLKI